MKLYQLIKVDIDDVTICINSTNEEDFKLKLADLHSEQNDEPLAGSIEFVNAWYHDPETLAFEGFPEGDGYRHHIVTSEIPD